MIDQELVCKVNQLKELHPCSTSSLDRTPYHNASVGGAKGSWHLKGLAVDLVFDAPSMLIPAALYAKTLGFGGIEVNFRNMHLHLDLRPTLWHVVCITGETLTLDEFLTLPPSRV